MELAFCCPVGYGRVRCDAHDGVSAGETTEFELMALRRAIFVVDDGHFSRARLKMPPSFARLDSRGRLSPHAPNLLPLFLPPPVPIGGSNPEWAAATIPASPAA